ncbi:MAG: tRNA lysidine(34) synthetase TilS [Acetobacteraceae bacterium]|nr:tRNA lysidine(34) synthetase TilS [Acetobacteraceae bacterium]
MMRMAASDPFLKRLRGTIDKYGMVSAGDLVLVGVSGGPDSVALLLGLGELREHYSISLHVAHLNHRLRGREAEDDARFVAGLAARLGVPATVEEADVRGLALSLRLSLQEAARRARMEMFERLCSLVGANRVALGQNLEDQAETVLMRFLRGAGVEGLAGILPVRDGRYVRPLLETPRAEIEAFLARRGVVACRDPSNLRTVYLRNRLRLELLPQLVRRYNPALVEALAALAEQMRDDAELLSRQAELAWQEVARQDGRGIVLDRQGFLRLHRAVQRRVVREAFRRASGRPWAPEFRHVEAVRALAERGAGGKELSLPRGVRCRLEAGWVVVSPEGAAEAQPSAGGGVPGGDRCYPLEVPGLTRLPAEGLEVEAQLLPPGEAGVGRAASDEAGVGPDAAAELGRAWLDADRLRGPLMLRFTRPGDRMRPLGLGGSRKLHDLLVDRKVPRRQRQAVPVVADGPDPAWVVGVHMDERLKVTPATTRVLRLVVRRSGVGGGN